MKKISKMKNKKLFKKMSQEQRRYIYDKMKYEYTRADIIDRANDKNIKLEPNAIDSIAYQYVYDGKYDCNISYWDNLDILMANYESSEVKR